MEWSRHRLRHAPFDGSIWYTRWVKAHRECVLKSNVLVKDNGLATLLLSLRSSHSRCHWSMQGSRHGHASGDCSNDACWVWAERRVPARLGERVPHDNCSWRSRRAAGRGRSGSRKGPHGSQGREAGIGVEHLLDWDLYGHRAVGTARSRCCSFQPGRSRPNDSRRALSDRRHSWLVGAWKQARAAGRRRPRIKRGQQGCGSLYRDRNRRTLADEPR
mmetsp:Transcript_49637/g.105663  ORF Transcript_49637/g.105663 Transcript_49637/m.105663 type:complete len:217 (+) Transcript_49637:289-939(+)